MQETLELIHRTDHFLGQSFRELEQFLEARIPSFCGYPSKAIAQRIVQILLRDHYHGFLCASQKRQSDEAYPNLDGSGQGVFVRTLTPPRISRLQALKQLLYLAAVSAFYLFKIGTQLGRRQGKAQQVSVFLTPGLEAYLPEAERATGLLEYAQNGPVKLLRESACTLVQDPTCRTSAGHFHFCASPWREITRYTRWSPKECFRYALLAARTWISCAVRFWRYPELSLLGRDLAFHPMIKTLSRGRKLQDIILTTSAYFDQPIWLNHLPNRTFSSHMVWYATNTRPFKYKQSRFYSEHPSAQYLQVDCAWIWNRDHQIWIESATSIKKTVICGPILFKTPGDERQNPPRKRYDILVFDVTPVPYEWIQKNLLPGMYYYFNTENMKRFLSDVLAWRDSAGRKPKVALKAKRHYHKIHDQAYIQFVADLEKNAEVEIVAPMDNIYDIVAAARSVVVVPFSSPAYVAGQLEVPATFYDSSGHLDRPEWLQQGTGFVATRDELHNWLDTKLKSRSWSEPQPEV